MKKVNETLVSQTADGEVVLGYGQHEIKIELDNTPCRVSLSITSPCDATPVCHGDVNKIGVTILDDGFVLYADIKTNTCCIEWECGTDSPR